MERGTYSSTYWSTYSRVYQNVFPSTYPSTYPGHAPTLGCSVSRVRRFGTQKTCTRTCTEVRTRGCTRTCSGALETACFFTCVPGSWPKKIDSVPAPSLSQRGPALVIGDGKPRSLLFISATSRSGSPQSQSHPLSQGNSLSKVPRFWTQKTCTEACTRTCSRNTLSAPDSMCQIGYLVQASCTRELTFVGE